MLNVGKRCTEKAQNGSKRWRIASGSWSSKYKTGRGKLSVGNRCALPLPPGCPEGRWRFARFGAFWRKGLEFRGLRAEGGGGLRPRYGAMLENRVRTARNAGLPRPRGARRGKTGGHLRQTESIGNALRRGLGGERGVRLTPSEMRRHAFSGAWPKRAPEALARRCGEGRGDPVRKRRRGETP